MSFCVVALGAYMLFLFYYFFASLIFNRRQAKAKVFFRKTNGMRNSYLKKSLQRVCVCVCVCESVNIGCYISLFKEKKPFS